MPGNKTQLPSDIHTYPLFMTNPSYNSTS